MYGQRPSESRTRARARRFVSCMLQPHSCKTRTRRVQNRSSSHYGAASLLVAHSMDTAHGPPVSHHRVHKKTRRNVLLNFWAWAMHETATDNKPHPVHSASLCVEPWNARHASQPPFESHCHSRRVTRTNDVAKEISLFCSSLPKSQCATG